MRLIGTAFPSESAIDGMVRINQMGASLAEVSRDWFILLGLLATYFLFAVAGTHHLRRRIARAT